MSEEKINELASKIGYRVAADANNIGRIDLAFIRGAIKKALAMQCEENAKDIRNIYQSKGYAPGDWPTPEQCADLVEQKAKELRGEE